MPGKKRTTNQKTSATSKRHKSSASSSSKPKSKSAKPTVDGEPAAPAAASAFPADKPKLQSAKKDRKGKGPAFIPAVEGREMSDSDSDGAMDVDEDLEDLDDQADFLTQLDEKGMAA